MPVPSPKRKPEVDASGFLYAKEVLYPSLIAQNHLSKTNYNACPHGKREGMYNKCSTGNSENLTASL